MNKPNKLKIGLALGSGGPRGLAHIGVIKVLEKNNIPIDFIAGSSIGAMVGGFYASTKDIEKIEKISLGANWKQVASLVDPSLTEGLVSGQKVKKYIEKHIKNTNFKDLKIPLSVVATDLKSGESVIIDNGEVTSAIRASISVPLVFKPVKSEGALLADGGLSLPIPVDVAKNMGADIVIAVNLDGSYFNNPDIKNNKINFLTIINASTNVLRYQLASANIKNADIVVTPKLNNINWNKFWDSKDVILAGEKAMEDQLFKLQKLI